MKTTIYLIRHAEAVGNTNGCFMGRTDLPLSPRGLEQCELLAGRFCSVKLDRLYSSPLLRTKMTALAAGRASGLTPETNDGLIEIDGGLWEGAPWDELKKGEEFRLWTYEPHKFIAPEGEAMTEVYDRMRGAMEKLAAESGGLTIAVVSHGCAIRNFMSYALGLGIERMQEVPFFENTGVCKLEYDPEVGKFTLLEGPDAEHIPYEMRTMAHQSWWKK